MEAPIPETPIPETPIPETAETDGPYQPRVADVLIVKAMLCKATPLPVEIVDVLIDEAEYWPHTSASFDAGQVESEAIVRVTGGSTSGKENRFLLRTPPLGILTPRRLSPPAGRILKFIQGREDGTAPLCLDPPYSLQGEFAHDDLVDAAGVAGEARRLVHPCRRIVWHFRSCDQGWSGEPDEYKGTYQRSYTWFEAGIERSNKKYRQSRPSFNTDLPGDVFMVQPEVVCDDSGTRTVHHELFAPQNLLIQTNVHASRDMIEHTVTWTWKDDIAANPASPEEEKRVETELRLKGRGTATGDGEFVRSLKVGDMVTVWAKARFGAWCNKVSRVSVEVFWAV